MGLANEYAAETLRSLLPLVLKLGIATEQEVEIGTLAERLRQETVVAGSVVKTPEVVSAWALKPWPRLLSIRKWGRYHSASPLSQHESFCEKSAGATVRRDNQDFRRPRSRVRALIYTSSTHYSHLTTRRCADHGPRLRPGILLAALA